MSNGAPLRLELLSASSLVAPDEVRLVRLEGREAISTLYEHELTIAAEVDGGLSQDVIDDLLRMPAQVRFGPDGEEEIVSGIVRRVRMLPTVQPRPVHYVLTLVPRVFRLTLVKRSRVFQDLDVLGIVRAVLGELGFEENKELEIRSWHEHPPSEYTVQYQETDWAFLSRLCEHHGVFWFFTQEEDGERIVFADDNRAFRPLEGHGSIPFDARDGRTEGGALHDVERAYEVRPAKTVLREYNWRTPLVLLQSEHAADTTTGVGFVNHYGEHFKDTGEGAWLAQVRAEELLADRDVVEAGCTAYGLAPGHVFALEGHPLGELDREYAVAGVERAFDAQSSGGGARMRIRAIPRATPFRARRATPRPRIDGVMHAKIDGEVPGTAAPIDEHGRYKVLFPFDLVGQPGGKASRWVRLAQPASGQGYGIHFPLHIGVEVVVAHIDGDPDRPVILGSPPNTDTVTPVTNDNATQSQIRTKAGILMTWDDDC